MEAGDRRLPRWYPGRLVRPTVDTTHLFAFSCPTPARIISSDADNFSLSEQEDEENFDLSLISSLETDVIPCLGDDRVPDYLITQLAKVLQQGSQLLLNESDDDEYPPTPNSLTRPDGKSATRGEKADSERMGSTAPARGVSRERFSFWCLDLLFLICSDTSKGMI